MWYVHARFAYAAVAAAAKPCRMPGQPESKRSRICTVPSP